MTDGALFNLLLLAAALAWLATLTLSGSRIVRARNAFMLRRGTSDDFDWSPANVPAGFRLEDEAAPDAIVDAVRAMEPAKLDTDWQRALMLQAMLISHARDDGGISADLATTYRQIVHGRGYCADYVRVYIAAAATAGLFCRQWAFSFDGFGGHGHTFIEIFDRDVPRWTFLDVHNNVYAVKRGMHTPLGAMSLRAALLAAPADIEFRAAAQGRLGYPHSDKLLDYYRRGAREWYLLWGNDVAARESRGVARLLSKLSGRLAYRLGSGLFGVPPLVAVVTEENEPALGRMEALRRKILWAFALAVGLSGAFVLQWSFGPAGAGHV
jgi:hypothetical protein